MQEIFDKQNSSQVCIESVSLYAIISPEEYKLGVCMQETKQEIIKILDSDYHYEEKTTVILWRNLTWDSQYNFIYFWNIIQA